MYTPTPVIKSASGGGKLAAVPARLFGAMRRTLVRTACTSRIYNWSLGGSCPDKPALDIPDVWPGDTEHGRWICHENAYAYAGQSVEIYRDNWEPLGAGAEILDWLHTFSWLRDLRACGGDQARAHARKAIESWILGNRRWQERSWRPDICGRRLANWIALYSFYGASADEKFQHEYMDSLLRQARHLSRALPGGLTGISLLEAARGLIFAGLILQGHESWIEQGLDILDQETPKQILSDGSHVSRCPQTLSQAMMLYLDLRTAISQSAYPVPAFIQHALDRMGPALRFFRYGDQRLAVFNGGQENNETLITQVLNLAGYQGKNPRALPQSGFERVALGKAVLMVDRGVPPAGAWDDRHHAAPLAFEFSYGRERLFVNCGTHPADAQWQSLLRNTAAHNTLTVDDRNACEIRESGHIGRRPSKIPESRREADGACLLDMSHDGYHPLSGLRHRRALYLGAQGQDLRGEDEIVSEASFAGRSHEIAVRFHLHPDVQVVPLQSGDAVLLKLPSGVFWRFTQRGAAMTVEPSLYLGGGHQLRKTRQIVLGGVMDAASATINWRLAREAGEKRSEK